MKRTLFQIISASTLALALAACGSNVKLNDVPVESRTPSGAGGQAGRAPAASAVAPVEAAGTDAAAAGPVGIAKTIYFDYDSYVVKPEFQSAIDAHAKYLGVRKALKLVVEGHTDERGGREYNLALGQKRAEAVRSALGLLGVTDAQVEAVSFGKEKPAATGSSEEAFAKNRRAELSYR
jgi:peptidoglycan-associated lipoprotein